jgi:hypothetical protein
VFVIVAAAAVVLGIVGLAILMTPPNPASTFNGFQEARSRNSKEEVAGFALQENQVKWVSRLIRRGKVLG